MHFILDITPPQKIAEKNKDELGLTIVNEKSKLRGRESRNVDRGTIKRWIKTWNLEKIRGREREHEPRTYLAMEKEMVRVWVLRRSFLRSFKENHLAAGWFGARRKRGVDFLSSSGERWPSISRVLVLAVVREPSGEEGGGRRRLFLLQFLGGGMKFYYWVWKSMKMLIKILFELFFWYVD